ncbi:hypothetical protein [Benzoatithermus flavus]|uniref:Secreted protein n=1 Tax=Benzoatithermus flavus TaxID=3108223 RepID=A0ABU8XPF7_9PROT
MVELVLLACLLKNPQHCETFHVPFLEEMQLPQCVWRAQFRAAEWVAQHPDWALKKFTCELPKA